MNLYEILGVEKEATSDEIKKAYRTICKENHPDLKKGDEKIFIAATRAYEVLMDPEKRKKYDETGDTPDEQSVFEEARSQLTGLYQHVITTVQNLTYRNIVAEMKKILAEKKRGAERELQELETEKERLDKIKIRITGPDNIFERTAQALIDMVMKKIRAVKRMLDVISRITEQLDKYEDHPEKQSQMPGNLFIDFSTMFNGETQTFHGVRFQSHPNTFRDGNGHTLESPTE